MAARTRSSSARFGDASVNHSTAQAALNTAAHFALPAAAAAAALRLRGQRPRHQRADARGLGRAVAPRPARAALSSASTGDDPAGVARDRAPSSPAWVREHRRPAFLHLRTVRYLGHAGADVETAYRAGRRDRARTSTRDPLLATGALARRGRRGDRRRSSPTSTSQCRDAGPRRAPRRRCGAPQLATAEDVMRPLAPRTPAAVAAAVRRRCRRAVRRSAADARAGDQRALADVLDAHPESLVFGEDVGRKGGVYGVTRGLQRALRRRRASSTRCSTSSRSSAWRSARRSAGCCPSPRSSTSPTCTTPRTSCAARRRRCSSSRRARTATRWSCGSPGSATRRASAATSTTTTRSPCCATSRAS